MKAACIALLHGIAGLCVVVLWFAALFAAPVVTIPATVLVACLAAADHLDDE